MAVIAMCSLSWHALAENGAGY